MSFIAIKTAIRPQISPESIRLFCDKISLCVLGNPAANLFFVASIKDNLILLLRVRQ